MKNLKDTKVLGVILMVLSMVVFSLFIWWGTTKYEPLFAIGMFFASAAMFIGGLITYLDYDK